jgi:hypothetical protein
MAATKNFHHWDCGSIVSVSVRDFSVNGGSLVFKICYKTRIDPAQELRTPIKTTLRAILGLSGASCNVSPVNKLNTRGRSFSCEDTQICLFAFAPFIVATRVHR